MTRRQVIYAIFDLDRLPKGYPSRIHRSALVAVVVAPSRGAAIDGLSLPSGDYYAVARGSLTATERRWLDDFRDNG